MLNKSIRIGPVVGKGNNLNPNYRFYGKFSY